MCICNCLMSLNYIFCDFLPNVYSSSWRYILLLVLNIYKVYFAILFCRRVLITYLLTLCVTLSAVSLLRRHTTCTTRHTSHDTPHTLHDTLHTTFYTPDGTHHTTHHTLHDTLHTTRYMTHYTPDDTHHIPHKSEPSRVISVAALTGRTICNAENMSTFAFYFTGQ